MKNKIESMVGKKFNRWTLLKFVGEPNTTSLSLWECQCDCGTKQIRDIRTIKYGGSKSCGCWRREVTTKRNLENNPGITTHGMTGSPEMSAFKDARRRCNHKHYKRYKDYGGRGIKFLFNSFEEFFSEVGPRPGIGYSIDRIDNNSNYESGNVKWSTTHEQAMNRRLVEIPNLTGNRYGRLTVLSKQWDAAKRRTKWLCRCDCGKECIVATSSLGLNTNSCGCLRREATSIRMRNRRKV